MDQKRGQAHGGDRRQEILEVAQRLVTSKGYEQMTIEDILAELHISKGAFYHYFDSKADLLEALIIRMRDDASRVLLPILEDPSLPALQKFQRWFETASQWKTARKDYLLSLIQVWYRDDNAVVRLKLRGDMLAWISPWLTAVVRQGIEEGVFTTRFPEHVGQVVYSLLYDLGDRLAAGVLSGRSGEKDFDDARRAAEAFADAIERALGARPGTLPLVDANLLREWYATPVSVG
jgi:AcrR family transcriptional regulator